MPIYMSKTFKNHGVTFFVTMLFEMLECSLNWLFGHFKQEIMSVSQLLRFMIDLNANLINSIQGFPALPALFPYLP